MNSLQYEYTKVRSEFGTHPQFGDNIPSVVSIDADDYDEATSAMWVKRAETTVNLDCIDRLAEHDANTDKFVQKNEGCLHVDGAWPAEVKTSEFVDRQRYLRRIKNDGNYQTSVMNLLKTAEAATAQNNTIDLFEDYFDEEDIEQPELEPVQYSSEPPSCRTVAVFRDPNEIKRSATHISWHPDSQNKLAVSYSILQFQESPEKMSTNAYIWDVNNPNEPDAELQPTSPLVCCEYNPRSPDHIAGGCYNGLVAFWDLRKGAQPVESSILEKSHHDPVYNVFWTQSRTGNECCTISTDGRLLWWDTRKLSEGPTDEMYLREGDDTTLFVGTAMEYRSDAGATKYLVGTEQGQAILVDRKASKDKGSQKSIKAVYGVQGKHHGPVYAVSRNPFNLKYFLTVGDWTAKVWMEDLRAPLMTTQYSNSYLTGACWSPVRPGVYYTTKKDGTMDVWDYHFKQNDPIFSTKVYDAGISSVSIQHHGKLVAVGSEEGTTSVLELSSALYHSPHEEKTNIANMFERETKREKNLEVRLIQKRREQKEKERAAGTVQEEFNPEAEWPEEVQARLKEAEEAFYKDMQKEEKANEDGGGDGDGEKEDEEKE